MNDSGKRSDIERLLAEAEGVLGGAAAPVAPGAAEVDPRVSRPVKVVLLRAALSGLSAAAVIWVVFAFLPFLGATSGAVAAFISTFVAVLVLRRR